MGRGAQLHWQLLQPCPQGPARPASSAPTPLHPALPGSLPCNKQRTRLVNQGLCVCGPRAANHICQSRRGWWGTTTGGGRLTFPGLYMNSISCVPSCVQEGSWTQEPPCPPNAKPMGFPDTWSLPGSPGRGLWESAPSNGARRSCPPAPPQAVHPDRSSGERGHRSWPAAGAPRRQTGDGTRSRGAHGWRAPCRSMAPGDGWAQAQCCPLQPPPPALCEVLPTRLIVNKATVAVPKMDS